MAHNFVKSWRLQRGLSQEALAQRMFPVYPLSYVSVGRIERGQQGLDEGSLEGLAYALDVPVAALVGIDPAKLDPPELKRALGLLRRWDDLSTGAHVQG